MKHQECKLIAALSLCAAFAVPNLASAIAISGQGTWESALQGRDLDGDLATAEAYYDTVLDITWLADANFAMTSGYHPNGYMTWAMANSWAAGLNIGGVSGWRLPDTAPVNGTTYNYGYAYDGSADRGYNVSAPGTVYAGSTGSEMAHMFYNTLGNVGYFDTGGYPTNAGWGPSNAGPFNHLLSSFYWSATEYKPSPNYKWGFDFSIGNQGITAVNTYYAWAVHSGDVGTHVVPIPPAAWLLGSGVLGLVGVGGKRRSGS